MKVTLEAKYVPDLWVNLFSLTRAMMGGGQLGNKGLVITMSKNNKTIKFDKIFKTKNGYVGGVDICPTQQSQNVANLSMDDGYQIRLNNLHGILGHVGEGSTRQTSKRYGWEVRGGKLKCVDCGVGKMKQMSVPKDPVQRSDIKGFHRYQFSKGPNITGWVKILVTYY